MVSNEPRRVGEQTPRTEGTEPELANPHGSAHYDRAIYKRPTPVWVRLDALCIRDPGQPRHINGAGVEMSGERRGYLSHWVPTVDGGWLARVRYSIPYADGRPPLQLVDQLVPGYALRPRKEPDH